jgi:hypothetical protein
MKSETQIPARIKQVYLTQHTPHYWRVTFNNPPLNIFGPAAIPQLDEIITALETNIARYVCPPEPCPSCVDCIDPGGARRA